MIENLNLLKEPVIINTRYFMMVKDLDPATKLGASLAASAGGLQMLARREVQFNRIICDIKNHKLWFH